MVAEAFPLLYGRFPNYYELLGVSRNASKKDVSFAYKKTALREHPDKAGSTPAQNELFAAINNAKNVLTDDATRKAYDRKLDRHLHPRPLPPQSPKQSSTRPTPPQPPKQSFTRPGGYSYPDSSRPFEHFSHGTRFAQNPEFKPFGSGSGFGPERDATKANKFPSPKSSTSASGTGFAFADHSTKASRPENHKTGCPVCGSQFCPGSRYSGQKSSPDIPCSSRDHGFFFFFPGPSRTSSSQARSSSTSSDSQSSPKASDFNSSRSASGPAFGSHFKSMESASLRCTGDPDRCPKHNSSQFREETLWKEPFAYEGNPGYVDQNRTIPFQHFIPPASAYGRGNHNGTKPNTSAWHQARWRCLSLPNEHQVAASSAMQICDIAVVIERSLKTLAQHCARIDWNPNAEPYLRLVGAFHLLIEIMHFAAASYRYSGSLIDSTIFNQPDVAVPRLITIRNDLKAILGIMVRTRGFLDALIAVTVKPHIDMDMKTLGEGIRSIIVAWDKLVLLPDNITRGAQDVFFSWTGHLENTFERKTQTAGASYPIKPFMYRKSAKEASEQEHGIWDADDEEPTLRNWEQAQRMHEVTQEQEKETTQESGTWGDWFTGDARGGSGPGSDLDMSG